VLDVGSDSSRCVLATRKWARTQRLESEPTLDGKSKSEEAANDHQKLFSTGRIQIQGKFLNEWGNTEFSTLLRIIDSGISKINSENLDSPLRITLMKS
jgi:hypothetical protein